MKKSHWNESTEKRYWESIACACSSANDMEDVPIFLINDIASEYMVETTEVIEDCLGFMRDRKISAEIAAGHEFHHEIAPILPKDEVEKITGGDVFTVEEFLSQVEDGCIIDYDGYGSFVSGDGKDELDIFVDLEWLEEFKDEWPYVAWYNK